MEEHMVYASKRNYFCTIKVQDKSRKRKSEEKGQDISPKRLANFAQPKTNSPSDQYKQRKDPLCIMATFSDRLTPIMPVMSVSSALVSFCCTVALRSSCC